MISMPEHKVMGEDGQEYGPVNAEQIRQWILEQRLEQKSPVKSRDARDWVFLGSLPEFAGAFNTPAPAKKAQKRNWSVIMIVIIATAGLILFALEKINHR
jgi:hypothetical protein